MATPITWVSKTKNSRFGKVGELEVGMRRERKGFGWAWWIARRSGDVVETLREGFAHEAPVRAVRGALDEIASSSVGTLAELQAAVEQTKAAAILRRLSPAQKDAVSREQIGTAETRRPTCGSLCTLKLFRPAGGGGYAGTRGGKSSKSVYNENVYVRTPLGDEVAKQLYAATPKRIYVRADR
jgi:hypothetical protein